MMHLCMRVDSHEFSLGHPTVDCACRENCHAIQQCKAQGGDVPLVG